jgi:hypothetical protein
MGDSTLSDELVRAVALAIAQAIVDQKGSGATFDVGSMTIIDAGSNHGWEVLPVSGAAWQASSHIVFGSIAAAFAPSQSWPAPSAGARPAQAGVIEV